MELRNGDAIKGFEVSFFSAITNGRTIFEHIKKKAVLHKWVKVAHTKNEAIDELIKQLIGMRDA